MREGRRCDPAAPMTGLQVLLPGYSFIYKNADLPFHFMIRLTKWDVYYTHLLYYDFVNFITNPQHKKGVIHITHIRYVDNSFVNTLCNRTSKKAYFSIV